MSGLLSQGGMMVQCHGGGKYGNGTVARRHGGTEAWWHGGGTVVPGGTVAWCHKVPCVCMV